MAVMSSVALLTKLFKDMDKNGDGYLDCFEVEEIVKSHAKELGENLGYEELKNRVTNFKTQLDADGDNRISLEEFLNHFLGGHK